MLYVDRKSVETPEILLSDRVEREKIRMNDFFNQQRKKKQTQYDFKNRFFTHRQVKKSLEKLFHGKCAYCESIVTSTMDMTIDHFRPKQYAMNLDGTVSKNHYWWLAYEWTNLYSSCSICNSSKSTRFPVIDRRISRFKQVNNENALLLDPCNKDDFEESHLIPEEDGFLVGITKKGKVSVDVFKLNRPALIEARKRIFEELKLVMTMVMGLNARDDNYETLKGQLMRLLAPSSEHTSVALYHFHRLSQEQGDIENSAFIKEMKSEFISSYDGIDFLSNEFSPLASIEDVVIEKRQSYKIDFSSNVERETYFMSSKKIRSIEIKNFKIIEDLKLNFPKQNKGQEPWLVLLGENGAGKSSVLQAVSLALAGEISANSLGLDASRFVNRNSKLKAGYVKVFLDSIDEPAELHFKSNSNQFSSNYKESKVILLAFGSTRLMAKKREIQEKNTVRNLQNLFDPFTTLPNVEEWLSNPQQVNTAQFDQIAFELKKLLQLPDDKLIYRRKTSEGEHELFIKINEGKKGIRVRELSAGYQAIIAMALNIIKEVLTTWDNFSIAEGIVLIDEIGVHLHPKWKLQIISTLRDIFPAMNFIITTHEPLCLRGVNEGEVALMKLNENNQVIALVDLPSPKGLTVEQLITSKFFGLITSFDPEVESQLNSFYLLKSKRNPTTEQKDRLAILKEDLEEMHVIDNDSNLEVLKNFSASSPNSSLDAGWIANPKHQNDLKNKIKEIWSSSSSRNK